MNDDYVRVSLELDLPGKVAELHLQSCAFEIKDSDSEILCPGYGYLRTLDDGRSQLVALFAHKDRLCFFYGAILDLTSKEFSFELAQGFFRDRFTILRKGQENQTLVFKSENTNSEVLEDLVNMFKRPDNLDQRLRNRVVYFSELDPERRQLLAARERKGIAFT